jgi:mitogen-activated protein kinase kinase kinase 7
MSLFATAGGFPVASPPAAGGAAAAGVGGAGSTPSAMDRAVSSGLVIVPFGELELETPAISTAGASCDVYRARWRGRAAVALAVKVMKGGGVVHEEQRDGFLAEGAVIAPLHHPHVVQVYGVICEALHTSSPRVGLVMELMAGGSVHHAIMNPATCPPLRRRLQWWLDAAYGLRYLHAMKPRPLIHADIKALNILIDGEGNGKLADFGLSQLRTASSTRGGDAGGVGLGAAGGSLPWMAPELFGLDGNLRVGTRSDVYAMGVTLWEVCACRVPFTDLASRVVNLAAQLPALIAGTALTAGVRPTMMLLPADTPAAVRDVMQRMWAARPEDRCRLDEAIAAVAACLDGLGPLPPWGVAGLAATLTAERDAAIASAAALAAERDRAVAQLRESAADHITTIAARDATITGLRRELDAARSGAAGGVATAAAPARPSLVDCELHADAVTFERTRRGERVPLGEGSVYMVYAATFGDKPCVVKVPRLPSGVDLVPPELQAAFWAEVRTQFAFHHPHIVAMHGGYADVDPAAGGVVDVGAVMERCSGGTLEKRLHGTGAAPGTLKQRLTWASQVLSALAYLHAKDIIHADPKPENVLLEDGSPTARAKLTDFAQSVRTDADEPELLSVRGSYAFMDPRLMVAMAGARVAETDDGSIRKASDVYSAGVLLWELATVRRPYDKLAFPPETAGSELLQTRFFGEHVTAGGRPSTPAELAALAPAGLGALIGRMWASRAEDRPTIVAAGEELARLVAGLGDA